MYFVSVKESSHKWESDLKGGMECAQCRMKAKIISSDTLEVSRRHKESNANNCPKAESKTNGKKVRVIKCNDQSKLSV